MNENDKFNIIYNMFRKTNRDDLSEYEQNYYDI